MSLLVSQLIASARTILNDGQGDNFAQDDLSDLVDGATVAFRAYNQNIQNIASGAPSDPKGRVNGILSAVASFSASTGIVTLTAPPAAGSLLYLEYFFVLMLDAQYLGFAQEGVRFLGNAPVFAAVGDSSSLDGPLAEAVVHYMAHLGASKMANLSSWYYRSNAGNKSFDKAVIAQAFKATALEEYKTAVDIRDGLYTREGRRAAPSWARGNTPFTSYTPMR